MSTGSGPVTLASRPPEARGAATWRTTLAQAGMELRLTARRGENVLVMIVIPAVVLVFFAAVPIVDLGPGPAVDVLVPGTLALAIIATSFVNLGIATAYERVYGVLKRLGGTPLSRGGLVGAKLLAVTAVEVVQVVLLIGLGLALGWRPGPAADPLLALVALLLGTLAFAGLGLAMAGTLRAEATLGLANALFLVFLLLGGVIVPVDRLPEAVAAVARLLPAAALSEALRAGLGAPAVDATGPLVVLLVWGVGAVAVAARSFRWE